MYFALITREAAQLRERVWRTLIARSGLVLTIGVALLLLGVGFGWRAHMRGRFAQLKAELKKSGPAVAQAVRPGGQDPIKLERTQIEEGTVPEFLTAILLPGRGLNVFQITAYIPGKGEVKLLASPSLEEAAKKLTGVGDDVEGAASLTMGGAFEAPWAGRIAGAASGDRSSVNVNWRGESLSLPATWQSGEAAASVGGMLLKMPATSSNTNVMPDGGEAEVTFNAGGFDGRWLSSTEISTTVQLNSRAIEMRMVAKNTGTVPEPMGMGWQPRFAILNDDRASIRLRLPSNTRAEARDGKSGLLTGKLVVTEGGDYDFTGHNGARLGSLGLDDSFVHLKQALLDTGPVAEILDQKSGYGLRITALNPAIKVMHVYAPADGDFISIGPRFNYDDPFGKQWPADEDTGMVVLAPGQSAEWRIRLEIFSLKGSEAQHSEEPGPFDPTR